MGGKPISGTEETIVPVSVRGEDKAAPELGPDDDYPELITVDPQHYLLGAELARGGMGRILRARDRRLGRRVAIKELLRRDPALAARFEREARITARLQHPAIVSLHEAGRWPTGEPFFAMKLVAGRPLDRVIADAKTLPERLGLLPNVIAAVDALAYAHAARVVHRDLKPGNVLVGEYGETVVIDWGLAKELDAEEPELPRSALAAVATGDATLAGTVIGTPAYMPPEQAAGEKVDERADVYALGALLYHVLTGQAPYEAKSIDAMLGKVLAGPPPAVSALVPDAPVDLVAIVDKAMARRPDDRFATAHHMVDELKRFQTGQLVTSHRYTAWQLVRRWLHKHRAVVAVAALATVVLLVLGALGLSTILDERDRADREAREARLERANAEQRATQVTLAQATSSLDLDPSHALALLGQVRSDPRVVEDIRRIAADAASRGTAHLLPGNGRVHGLALSSDGRWLAAGGVDRKLRLWDTRARTVRALEGHAHPILDVAIVGDDVVSVDARGAVHRWSIARGTGSVLRAAGATDVVRARIAPGGETLAILRTGGAELWQLGTGETRAFGELELAGFSPDGRTFVGYSQIERKVLRLDLTGGRTTTTLDAPELVTAIATDGRRIVIGDDDEKIRDLTVEVMVPPGTKHAGFATSLALLPDGTIVSASSDVEYTYTHHEVERRFRSGDYTVVVWPFEPHEALRYRGHPGNIDAIAVTLDGKHVASAGRDGTIRVWTRPAIVRRRGHAQLDAAVLAADRRELAVINNGSEVDVHDVASDRFRTLDTGLADAKRHSVTQVAVADSGRQFATLDLGREAVYWDTGSTRGRVVARDVSALTILRSGARVITADSTGAVRAWDPTSGQVQVLVAPQSRRIVALAAGADDALAIVDADGRVSVHARGAERALTPAGEPLRALAFSPDGTRLVGGGGGAQLHVWTVASGALRSWRGHDDAITRLTFAPDGQRVATASTDNTVRVWEVDGSASTVLRGHAGTIATMVFRADGRALLTAGDDRTVRLWDLPGGAHRVVARHGDYVVYAGFLADDRQIISVDHADEFVIAPDDLPHDDAGLRRWMRAATNYAPP